MFKTFDGVKSATYRKPETKRKHQIVITQINMVSVRGYPIKSEAKQSKE